MSSELERRVAALERRIPQGMMVSTTYGRAEVRPFQVGFPVVLTSAFDPVTGYSWQQQVVDLSLPGVDSPPLSRTGDNAFTPDNDIMLQPGQAGWLEVDPQAQGWLFIPTPVPVAPALGSGSGSGSRPAICPISSTSIPYLAGILVDGYDLYVVQGLLQTYTDPATGFVQLCGGDYNEVFVGCLAPCGSGSGSGSGSGGSGGSGGGGVCATLTVEIDSPNCPSLNGTYSINGGANVGNTWYGQFTCPSQPASPCISSISFIPSGPVNAPTGGTLTIDIICPDGKSETVSITLSGTCCPLSIAGAGTINPQAGLVYCCSGATLNASVLDQCGGPSTPCNCPSQVPLELTITGGCTSANGTHSIPWAANNDGINTWLYEGGNTGGSIPPANPTVSAVAITCSPGGLNNSQLTYQYAVTIELSNGTYETFSGTLVVPCGTTSLSINIPGCGSGSGPSGECPQVGQTVSAAVSGPVGSGEYTLQVTSPTTSNYTNTNCNGNLSTGVDCLVTVQLNCGITGLGPYVDITGYCANGTSFTVDIPVTISGNTFSGSQSCPNINCGGGTCVNGTWTVSGSWS